MNVMTAALTRATPLDQALGAHVAQRLVSCGLSTTGDLITYWPRKWRERGEHIDLALVPNGQRATVHTTITKVTLVPLRSNPNRKFLSVEAITDHGRNLKVSLFAAWQARKDGIAPGVQVTFSGQVKYWRGKAQMSNPEYALTEQVEDDFAGKIVAIYPATAQAPSPFIAAQVRTVLDQLDPQELADPLPAHVLERRDLATYPWAVRNMHIPESLADAERAKKRLTYDEAFAVQLTLALKTRGAGARSAQALPGAPGGDLERFETNLPFTMTPGQRLAGGKIAAKLASTTPTNALLLGDVGAGKTIVALRAMLQATDSGAQCAFVAPTEVLAAQHYDNLTRFLAGTQVRVALLSGNATPAQRKQITTDLAQGRIDIIVGTPVLTSASMDFANLGLVVIDEQHRFGVAARDALRARPTPPHMLVMTATPIPRTLAMTVYGDLDTIELQGLPEGRKPITTHVVPAARPEWVARVFERIGEEVAQGRQAFVVAARIDDTQDDETAQGRFDTDTPAAGPTASLADLHTMVTTHLPTVRTAMLHGRMDPATKAKVMDDFTHARTDVLVATTVIEVGVDVPNASVMVVWDADRFGIAQLHQLRGRVGRGQHEGLCLLVTAQGEDHPSRSRLETVASTTDGHKLAQADLKARREGDILGTGQAGRSRFKLLDLTGGQRLIAAARRDAQRLVDQDPALRSGAHQRLATWLDQVVGEDEATNLTRA